jgi:hypothetical protein
MPPDLTVSLQEVEEIEEHFKLHHEDAIRKTQIVR